MSGSIMIQSIFVMSCDPFNNDVIESKHKYYCMGMLVVVCRFAVVLIVWKYGDPGCYPYTL